MEQTIVTRILVQVIFKLQYEEMLERDKSWYEHKINLNTDETIADLKVEVFIEETLSLTDVRVPRLLMTNEISQSEDRRQELEQEGGRTDWKNGTSHLLYAPSVEEQEDARAQVGRSSLTSSTKHSITEDVRTVPRRLPGGHALGRGSAGDRGRKTPR